jgi:hypothetical protein
MVETEAICCGVSMLVMLLYGVMGDCFKRTKLRLAGPQEAQD